MERLTRHWKLLVLVIFLLAFLVTMTLTSGDRSTTFVERLLTEAANPILKAFDYPVDSLGETYHWLVEGKRAVMDENERLKKEAERSEFLETLLYERERELEVIRRFLNYSASSFPRDGTMARVVGRNPDNWFSTVMIDRGSNHGVANGDIVLAENGLVGRIYRSSSNTSSVLLLCDPTSSVGVMVQRSRYPGIVRGVAGSEMLKMSMFSREADVEPGDKVITSGLGSMYPQGILIGIVNCVFSDEYGLLKSALVEPSVDFDRLEEVIVIKGKTSSGGNAR